MSSEHLSLSLTYLPSLLYLSLSVCCPISYELVLLSSRISPRGCKNRLKYLRIHVSERESISFVWPPKMISSSGYSDLTTFPMTTDLVARTTFLQTSKLNLSLHLTLGFCCIMLMETFTVSTCTEFLLLSWITNPFPFPFVNCPFTSWWNCQS